MELSDSRRDFGKLNLDENSLPNDPVELLKIWLNDALINDIHDFNAMVISTISDENKPSSRIVLLKKFSKSGSLIFYTNYESRKGKEIAKNQNVCLNFFWHELERQIRIEGIVEKTSREISESYFNSRPIESRISAVISPQSHVIESLEELREKASAIEKSELKIPDYWGGYEVFPDYFEFWQGGSNRLHDRICYSKKGQEWIRRRLAP